MAEQFGIRLSVDVDSLIVSVNQAISKINGERNGEISTVKLNVDTSKFDSAIKKLKTELASITGKSTTPKVELGTSRADGQVTLDELTALKKVEEELANPKGLAAVQVEFSKTTEVVKGLTNAVSAFKAEYSSITGDNIKALREQVQGLTVDLANSTKANVGGKSTTKTSKNKSTNAENAAVEAAKEQQQEYNKVGQAVEEAAQKAVEAEKKLERETQNTNNLLKTREILYEKTGNKRRAETYGDSSNRTTYNYLNGNKTSTVTEINLERQRKLLEQNYAAASKLASELDNVAIKYAGVNKESGVNKEIGKAAVGEKNGIGAKQIIKDANALETLNGLYEKIKTSIEAIKTASAGTTSQIEADVKTQIDDYKRLVEAYQRLETGGTSLRKKDVDTIKQQQTSSLDEFYQKVIKSGVSVDEFKGKVSELKTQLENVTNRDSLTNFLNEFDILKSKFSALNEQARTTADISKQIEKALNGLDKISNNPTLFRNKGYNEAEYSNLISSVDALKNKYLELQSSLKTDSSAENLANVKARATELEEELKKTGRQAANLKAELGGIKIDENAARKVAQTHALIADLMRKNAYAMGKENTISGSGLTFGQELSQLESQLKQFPDSVNAINNQVRVLQANIKTLGYEGNTLLGEMKEKITKFVKWTGMTLLVTKARMYIRKLFTTVYELDTALIDLRKTFKGTNEELEDFYFEANKLAKQMGVTTQEIIQQGSAWSRLGYSTNEAMKKMAEMSSMFAAISPDMNVEQAQNGLVSIMKAFDIDPNNVLDEILSKVNIIGNTAATSNGEIVTMLEKSSSAMKEANNTLEQTIALETAAMIQWLCA